MAMRCPSPCCLACNACHHAKPCPMAVEKRSTQELADMALARELCEQEEDTLP